MNTPPNTIWRGLVTLAARGEVDCIVSVDEENSQRVLCWEVLTDDLGNPSVERVHVSNHHHQRLITDRAITSMHASITNVKESANAG